MHSVEEAKHLTKLAKENPTDRLVALTTEKILKRIKKAAKYGEDFIEFNIKYNWLLYSLGICNTTKDYIKIYQSYVDQITDNLKNIGFEVETPNIFFDHFSYECELNCYNIDEYIKTHGKLEISWKEK
jgi:hypothetical protein